jgi:hypothetical protein
MNYQNFLEGKIRIAEKTGFDFHPAYWQDSIKHVRSTEMKQAALTLF